MSSEEIFVDILSNSGFDAILPGDVILGNISGECEMERKKGLFAAFGAGLAWGCTSPIAQYLFDEKGIVSQWLVPYRMVLAGILLLIYAVVVKKQNPKVLWTDKNDIIRLFGVGILGMMGMQYSFFVAIQETNAGVATIFQYLNPAILLLFYAVVYRVMPHKKEIIAVGCSIVGIFLVATQGNVHQLSMSPKGFFMGMVLAITTCFYGVLPGPLLKKYPAESMCGWAMLIGGIVLSIVLRPWKIEVHMDLVVLVGYLVITIAGTILPFLLYLAAVKYAGSVYAGLLSSVEPVAATIVAAVFLGTSFPAIDILGFALVLSTLFILNINAK